MKYVSQFKILGETIQIRDPNRLTEIVWLGDSFTTGFQAGGSYISNPIPRIVSDKLQLNMHNFGVNASGYATVGDGGSTFATQANNAINDTSFDNDKVKYVCILGGLNDYNNVSLTADAIAYASKQLVSTLYNAFKNAIIVAIPNWAAFDMGNYVQKMLAIGDFDYTVFNRRYLFLRKNLLSLQGYSSLINSDNVHPNQQGAIKMAECIYSLMHGVEPNIYRKLTPIANDSWDLSNFEIVETFEDYRFKGSIQALTNITPENDVLCEFPHGLTYFGVPFIVVPSKSATAACILEFYPSIDAVGAGSNGYIRMRYDLGHGLVAGDHLLIDFVIKKNYFI